jgi:hypothetical protein
MTLDRRLKKPFVSHFDTVGFSSAGGEPNSLSQILRFFICIGYIAGTIAQTAAPPHQ